jgi:pimeloyl-ACP methyl ester carboxylesterase
MNSVFLIHGFPFDHRMWAFQTPALKWRAFAQDLPGAGPHEGRPPTAYSMSMYASGFIELLDRWRMEQGVFCGLSMGGYILFEILRRFPDRVRAAILCHTKASADSPDAKNGRDTLAARARKEGMGAVADELVNRMLARTTRERQPEVVEAVTKMILRQNVPGVVGALQAMRDRPDSTPLLSQIRVPVLVIAGDDDQITPAAGMEEMTRAIPGAQFMVIPSSGHLSPIEQPAAVNAALNDFLARL